MAGWWMVGSLSEALFFGGLFLLGVFSLAGIITWQVVHPESPILRVGFGFWLLVTATGSFAIIGGTGLILRVRRVVTSDEHQRVLAGKAREKQGRRGSQQKQSPPSLPGLQRMTDSPGVRLAFRLPSSRQESVPLILATIFALCWNAMWAVLVVLALSQILQGRPRWFLLALIIPFGYVGYRAARWFVFLFRQVTGVGATTVEIDELPITPGRSHRIIIFQYGRLAIKRLLVSLVCDEQATYQQGTDIRTEHHSVYRQVLVDQGRSRVEPGRPLELAVEFSLPSDAMHSFQSEHNAVHWKIIVEGEAKRWPSYCRSFPVVVYPADRVIASAISPN